MDINFNHISQLYFVGIGGIGMSAIVRHFLKQGKQVFGYDKTATKLTEQIEKEGAIMTFTDAVEEIDSTFLNCPKEHTLVIYTPAVPKESAILNWFVNNAYQVIKRSEALAELTKNHFTIAVAGTHGKTTTCNYLAHILMSANIDFTAFLGGISANYGSNYLTKGDSAKGILVVEADEYDRSFHKLSPDISVITSMEADHLDIYGSHNELIKAFQEFANRTKKGGKIIVNDLFSDKILVHKENSLTSYGANNKQFSYSNVVVSQHRFHFDVDALGNMRFENGLPGEHNIQNALAAMVAAKDLVSISDMAKAIKSFKGAKRRFEFIYEDDNSVYIDDYAHHPTEVKYAIETAKKLYPKRKLTVVFQPHLYSRTLDHAEGFAQELSKADDVIIMPIYPARELPIEGVSSEMVLAKMPKGQILDHKSTENYIEKNRPALLLTLGAGNIDLLIEPISSIYQKQKVK